MIKIYEEKARGLQFLASSFWLYLRSKDSLDGFSLGLVGNRVMRRGIASVVQVGWLREGRLKAGVGEIFLGETSTSYIRELVFEGAGESMAGVCGSDGSIFCAKGTC